MSEEKQIEEMAEILRKVCEPSLFDECDSKNCNECMAEAIYNAGYRRQREGEWIAKHHMSRSSRGRYTSYNTYTCNICGKTNGRRNTAFCPNCGARMKGGGAE